MNSTLFEKLKNLSEAASLPEYGELFELSDRAANVLESEKADYRPLPKKAKCGGLLDFTSPGTEKLPLIVVPDLHARAYFLFNILNFELPESFSGEKNLKVFEALEQKKIRIVCVGDLLHSELRCRERWIHAFEEEFMKEEYCGKYMTQEMEEGLSLLSMVMELKCAFPEHFHVLKGNHENILNHNGDGDFSFCKFAYEGEMVRCFMSEKYGDDMLYVISCFEKALPLVAAFSEVVVSHGEPLKAYSRNSIIDGLSNPDLIRAFTWTENNKAQIGDVEAMLCELTGRNDFLNARYLAGHRPVKENYALRQNGYFIQIHNPDRENIALVSPGKIFNPDEDIYSVNQGE